MFFPGAEPHLPVYEDRNRAHRTGLCGSESQLRGLYGDRIRQKTATCVKSPNVVAASPSELGQP